MPKNIINEIKKTIDSLKQVDQDKKVLLNEMLEELRSELGTVKPDQAKNIAESARKVIDRNEDEADLLNSLHKSVSEFETEHPKLVDTVNRLCLMLSDIGI